MYNKYTNFCTKASKTFALRRKDLHSFKYYENGTVMKISTNTWCAFRCARETHSTLAQGSPTPGRYRTLNGSELGHSCGRACVRTMDKHIYVLHLNEQLVRAHAACAMELHTCTPTAHGEQSLLSPPPQSAKAKRLGNSALVHTHKHKGWSKIVANIIGILM